MIKERNEVVRVGQLDKRNCIFAEKRDEEELTQEKSSRLLPDPELCLLCQRFFFRGEDLIRFFKIKAPVWTEGGRLASLTEKV